MAAPELCAEFPPRDSDDDNPAYDVGFEGWWNATPSDAQGGVVTDVSQWPPTMREHPSTAVVDSPDRRAMSAGTRGARTLSAS